MNSEEYVRQGEIEREKAAERKRAEASRDAGYRKEISDGFSGGGRSGSGCMVLVVGMLTGGVLVRWLLR